jgi:hypothetical protein
MTATSLSIEQWVTRVVAGSLITQLAQSRAINLESPEAGDHVITLSRELAELGLDPECVAEHVMVAMAGLLMRQENAQALTTGFTDILWSILGDPKRNGDKPPELYRRAGFYLFVTVLGLFDSSIPDNVLKHRD